MSFRLHKTGHYHSAISTPIIWLIKVLYNHYKYTATYILLAKIAMGSSHVTNGRIMCHHGKVVRGRIWSHVDSNHFTMVTHDPPISKDRKSTRLNSSHT